MLDRTVSEPPWGDGNFVARDTGQGTGDSLRPSQVSDLLATISTSLLLSREPDPPRSLTCLEGMEGDVGAGREEPIASGRRPVEGMGTL